MCADIHDGQEHKPSVQGPDTEAQDQSSSDRQIQLATHGRSIQRCQNGLTQSPLALLIILLNLRQELENGSGECCRITTRPIVVDILKNDLLSPRHTLGDRLADQRE